MVAGLPGTGIGGIFYLMISFCMPLRELPRLIRGKSSLKRWKFIMRQWMLTAGIVFGFWMTGLMLAKCIPAGSHLMKSSPGNIFKFEPLIITISVLSIVLIIVESLQFFIPKSKPPSHSMVDTKA
jgi:hypothetical protein